MRFGFPRAREICRNLAALLLIFGEILAEYKIGVGIADITGPTAEIVFAGYAKSTQKGCGLHLRQFARAFVIEDENRRVLFVSSDVCMVGVSIRTKAIMRLKNIYGNTYNENNFILSATHTHSGPGGQVMDLLFDIPTFGFVQETFDAIVSGVVKAVIKAHESRRSGRIVLSSGEVLNININRSPPSYLLNPEAEREIYPYNVDKEMVQLKFVSEDDIPIGAINWFAVHPTSMNNSNCLVSSDNMGYASVLMEKYLNGNVAPGKGSIVTAFASSNLGDVSPNIKGPRCINTGQPCDDVTSTCDGLAKYCIASGPGENMFESTRIIAERLFEKAKELWAADNGVDISGPIKYAHQYVDMPSQKTDYELPNGTTVEVRGCLPAMGYSFAAGTTDGPGEFDFKQGTNTSNVFWNLVRDFIATPTEEDIKCHRPKPILIATGRAIKPYPWQPRIVPLQIATIGTVVIAAVPGEFTTMSGRRLRRAIIEASHQNDGPEISKVVVAGLSNIYSDYIATPEEYELQRYEAASTIFGPHTLTIYLHLYKNLMAAILKNQTLEAGPTPPDFSDKLISLVPPVLFDSAGWKREFGDCLKQPPSTVKVGDTVTAKFISGHPRNNLMHNKTFLLVEKLVGQDEWETVATDGAWETKYIWKRTGYISASSESIVQWTIPPDTETGVYRIRHFGHYKYFFGGIFPYEGITNNFKVV